MMTLPDINYVATTPRYTTLAAVKKRLNIGDADTEWDTEITAAIVGAELAIDKYLGAPFPRPDWVPAITSVPGDVKEAALSAAIRWFNVKDAPFGTAGSDDYFGALTVGDVVREEVRRNPALYGYKVQFGIGGQSTVDTGG